jgi:hypothetical protein
MEGLSTDDPQFRRLLRVWWQNPRPKEFGGLRLSQTGFDTLSKYFKPHLVRFETKLEDLKFSNQLIVRLDNYITCPWFITKRGMYVFDDKMAIQLVLFSGNIEKFTSAKARAVDKSKQ